MRGSPYKGRRMPLGLFRSTHVTAIPDDESPRGSAGTCRRRPASRQIAAIPQPDRAAGFERQVEPARAGIVGARDRIVGAGDARILETEIQPVAGHGLELGAEAGSDEVAEQAPFRFVARHEASPDHRVARRARHAEQGAGCCSLSVARSARPAGCTGGYGLRGGSGSHANVVKIRQIRVGIRRIRRTVPAACHRATDRTGWRRRSRAEAA